MRFLLVHKQAPVLFVAVALLLHMGLMLALGQPYPVPSIEFLGLPPAAFPVILTVQLAGLAAFIVLMRLHLWRVRRA